MSVDQGNAGEGWAGRPRPSHILAETDRRRRDEEARLTPGERMQRAFALSCDLRRMFWAGQRAQGRSDAEIAAAYRIDRR
jgi:hypothetical protein